MDELLDRGQDSRRRAGLGCKCCQGYGRPPRKAFLPLLGDFLSRAADCREAVRERRSRLHTQMVGDRSEAEGELLLCRRATSVGTAGARPARYDSLPGALFLDAERLCLQAPTGRSRSMGFRGFRQVSLPVTVMTPVRPGLTRTHAAPSGTGPSPRGDRYRTSAARSAPDRCKAAQIEEGRTRGRCGSGPDGARSTDLASSAGETAGACS